MKRSTSTARHSHYDLGLAYLDIRDYASANREAHAAYRLGYPLPGLRLRLERMGRWKAPHTPAPEAQRKEPPAH